MKIKSRLLATLLAVLMIVGSIPLMISADSGSAGDFATITKPEVNAEPLQAALEASGGELLVFSDFGNIGETGTFMNGTKNFKELHSDTSLLTNGSKFYMVSKKNGGHEYKFFRVGEEDGNKFVEMVSHGNTSYTPEQLGADDENPIANMDDYYINCYTDQTGAGKSFCLSFDIALNTAVKDSIPLVQCITRSPNSTESIFKHILSIDSTNYKLKTPDGKVVADFIKGVMTNIAVLVRPMDNQFDVYVNGAMVAEGVKFFNDNEITKLNDNNEDGSVTMADYTCGEFRLFQVGAKDKANTSWAARFDNICMYRNDTYVGGMMEDKTGLIEEGGKVYYYSHGIRTANADLGSFKTDITGALYRPVRVGNFIDFSNIYYNKADGTGANSTDARRDVVNKGNAFMPNFSDIPGATLWEMPQITDKKTFNLPINPAYKTADIANHDEIEFVFYGEDTQRSVFMFMISSADTSQNRYISKYVDMISDPLTLYGKNNGTWQKIDWSGNEAPVEDQWYSTSLRIDNIGASGWGISREFNIAAEQGLKDNLTFQTSGWNMASVYDGSTEDAPGNKLINNGEGTVTFAGIYVVDYVYATSVSDVNAAYINIGGVNVPLYGSKGWATYGEKQYYYAPWTGELVRNSSFIDISTKLCYVADANGACTLANGVIQAGNYKYYYVDGVAATGVQTIDGIKYEVLSNGIINRNYAGYTYPAPYVQVDHGDVSENAAYATLATFNNSTVSGTFTYDGQSVSDMEKGKIDIINKNTLFEIVEDSAGDKALKLTNKNTSVDPFFQFGPSVKGGKVIVDMDLKIGDNWNAVVGSMIRDTNGGLNTSGGNKEAVPFKIDRNGYFCSGDTPIAMLSSDEYTRISMLFDMDAHKFSYYVNGVLVLSDIGFNAQCYEIDLLRMFQYSSDAADTHGDLYLDNFAVYGAAEPIGVVSATLTTGAVEYSDGSIRFYNNGRPASAGIVEYADMLYKKDAYGVANIASGEVSGKWYFNGVLADGEIGGKWYDDGYLRNGVYGGLMYVGGVIADGDINGRLYSNGIAVNGNIGGKWYDDGYIRNGKYNGKMYVDGVLLSGTYEGDGLFYQNGEAYNGLYGADKINGVYYVDGKTSEGYIIDEDAKKAYIYGVDGKCNATYDIDYFNVTLIIKVNGAEEQRVMVAVTNGETFKFTVPARDGYTTYINNSPKELINVTVESVLEYEIDYVTNP